MKIISAISSGLSLLSIQAEMKLRNLKFDQSKAAEYIENRKKTIEAFKQLEKGKPDKLDSLREERRRQLAKLRQGLFSIATILIMLVSTQGCNTFNNRDQYQIPQIEVSELTTGQKTYPITSEVVITTNRGSEKFDNNWVIVHKDLLREFDLMQTQLIDKETNKHSAFLMIISGSIALVVLLIIIARRKK